MHWCFRTATDVKETVFVAGRELAGSGCRHSVVGKTGSLDFAWLALGARKWRVPSRPGRINPVQIDCPTPRFSYNPSSPTLHSN